MISRTSPLACVLVMVAPICRWPGTQTRNTRTFFACFWAQNGLFWAPCKVVETVFFRFFFRWCGSHSYKRRCEKRYCHRSWFRPFLMYVETAVFAHFSAKIEGQKIQKQKRWAQRNIYASHWVSQTRAAGTGAGLSNHWRIRKRAGSEMKYLCTDCKLSLSLSLAASTRHGRKTRKSYRSTSCGLDYI